MRADARKNYDQLLAVAGAVIAEAGADASLRDIARRAGVGLGTLYRHFPTREALLEALLRTSFNELATRAQELEESGSSGAALVAWLHDFVACARNYRGAIATMAAAIADEQSALHTSCVAMRSGGKRLLARAQGDGAARAEIEGEDLFALGAALAWLGDQPSFAPRADALFRIIARALLTDPEKSLPPLK